MKLIKLYSDSNDFQPSSFKEGLNLILGGKVAGSNDNITTHNVGKTFTVELILFCFLKKTISELNISSLSTHFSNYMFFLEVEIFPNNYLSLARSFEDHTVVYINMESKSRHFKDIKEFTKESIDGANELISTRVSESVGFDVNFSSICSRFIRRTSEFQDPLQIQMTSYNKKEISWVPGLINSFGIDFQKAYGFYDNREKAKNLDNKIKTLKNKLNMRTANKETIKRKSNSKIVERNNVEIEIGKHSSEINKFIFSSIDNKAMEKITLDHDVELARLKRRKYFLNKKIKNANPIKAASFDFQKDLLPLWEEINIVFNDQVAVDFRNAVEFNKDLIEERNKLVNQQSRIYKNELLVINKKISEIEKHRNSLVEAIQETRLKEKFEKSQVLLDETKAEKVLISKAIDDLNELDIVFDSQKNFEEKRDELFDNIKDQIKINDQKYCAFNEKLRLITKNLINTEIEIRWNPKKPDIKLFDVTKNEIIKPGESFSKLLSPKLSGFKFTTKKNMKVIQFCSAKIVLVWQ